MKKQKILLSLIFIVSFLISYVHSQTVELQYKGSYNYTLKERTDLRRYDNGKYTGLVSREVTSFITPTGYNDGYTYEGSFFLQEDTKRALENVGQGIRDTIPSAFKISSSGQLTMLEDNGFPSFRSFPTYNNQKIKPGDSWTGKAERAVDPLNKGVITKMPIYVQYTYSQDSFYHDEPVFLLNAQWATRYGMGSGTSYIDWGGDSELIKATGSHKATIYVSKITGNALVVRDSVDETFTYADGNVIQFKGTIALFTEYPPSYNKEKLLPALKRIAELSDNQINQIAELPENPLVAIEKNSEENLTNTDENLKEKYLADLTRRVTKFMENNKSSAGNKNQIAVDTTPAGIRLSIQNLQFKPNSAQLVEEENSRLNQIAEVLQTVPEAKLLVEGHTARIGSEDNEMELSIERAKSVAKELSKRGVSSVRFICKGHGGNKPVADNSTSEGRALNRRVEITILY